MRMRTKIDSSTIFFDMIIQKYILNQFIYILYIYKYDNVI